jgi:hypothetical protein
METAAHTLDPAKVVANVVLPNISAGATAAARLRRERRLTKFGQLLRNAYCLAVSTSNVPKRPCD